MSHYAKCRFNELLAVPQISLFTWEPPSVHYYSCSVYLTRLMASHVKSAAEAAQNHDPTIKDLQQEIHRSNKL